MQKTVLITGAARGIGRAITEELAEAGYAIVLHYHHSEQAAMRLKKELTAKDVPVLTVQADIADAVQVQHMLDTAIAQFGSIDALVNNAGIAQQKLFTDITEEDWRQMFAVHIDGSFYCCKGILPYMIRRKSGKIVNIASMWGVCGASCEVHYSAAKSALIGMTKALAKEVGPSNIQVNCVAPGVIATDMLSSFTSEEIAALREETPLGRIGTPQDIAHAVAFLLSDAADFITGQILTVDGGFSI